MTKIDLQTASSSNIGSGLSAISHFQIKPLHIVFVALISIIATAPFLYFNGLPAGGDFLQHLRFAVAYSDSIADGSGLPEWSDDNSGFGNAGVRVYPPLSTFVVALIAQFIGDLYIAFSLSIVIWMFVGCLGTFLFLREIISAPIALLGAFLFAIAPHHLMLVFRFFFFGEFVALSIFPYCVLFLTRAIRKGSLIETFLLSISLSALFLAHIPFTLIAAIALFVYSILLLERPNLLNVLSRLIFACLLSLLFSSFHWVKLIYETAWIKHSDPAFFSGYFSFNNWLFPSLLFGPELSTRGVSAQALDGDAALMIFIAVPAVFAWLSENRSLLKQGHRVVPALIFSTGICCFLASRASYFVWLTLSPLQNIQFPFRFFSPVAFLSSAAVVVAAVTTAWKSELYKRLFVVLCAVLLVGIIVFDYKLLSNSYDPKPRERFDKALPDLRYRIDADWWWPVWARSTAFENKEKVSTSDRAAQIMKWDIDAREFAVEEGPETTARIATFYYPFWKAEVNGVDTEVRPDETGAIIIAVPPESSIVRVVFLEPKIYYFAEWLSIISFCSVGLGLFVTGLSALKRSRQ